MKKWDFLYFWSFVADKNPSSKSAWYDLFAELDPLQNPDALGKVKDSDKARRATDGGSC